MGKYELKDAVMLKECMKQVATIRQKYPTMYLPTSIEGDLKQAVEFIQEMVAKDV